MKVMGDMALADCYLDHFFNIKIFSANLDIIN
jgi:hypothetical protein